MAGKAATRRVTGQANELLRVIFEGVAADTGERFFCSLVRNLAVALRVRHAFVATFADSRTRVRTLAHWGNGGFGPNFEFDLRGTPCEEVIRGSVGHHGSGLQQRFPGDGALREWGVDSYLGVPLVGASGEILGHLAVLDDQPMALEPEVAWVMSIFAARAAAELERIRADEAHRQGEERLARILDSAMDAFITVDDSGRIVFCNRAAADMLRCGDAPEAAGRALNDFFTEPLRDAIESAGGTLARASDMWHAPLPPGLYARRADGEPFPVEGTLCVSPHAGATLRTIVLRDTSRRQAEKETLRRLRLERQYLREEIKAVHNYDEIVGHSAAWREVLRQVDLVAATGEAVLLSGETGTGKELIARAVHSRSDRRDGPLVTLNCASLPSGLIEAELFGHEKGAFTGATARHLGRFELAQGGTIFLDEVGEIPPQTQVKLLRVLQDLELQRVGGNETIRVDVRVIAATNRNLSEAVAGGAFREDLYYRLHVFPIHLPPLRQRREDIPLLAHYFMRRAAARIGRRVETIPPETMRGLLEYDWPGNVRELENVIGRAVIVSRDQALQLAETLRPTAAGLRSVKAAAPPGTDPKDRSLQQLERDHIVQTLRDTGWVVEGPKGAARILGLHPNTLRSRMKKLGVRRATHEDS